MTKCGEGYTVNGELICDKDYESKAEARVYDSRYSILMDIGHEYCNMCCRYCCCHPKPKETNLKDYFKIDKEKMIGLIKESDVKRYSKPVKKHAFEIWGGEPLFNFDAFVETYDTLKEAFPESRFWTSTNGILLKDDKICEILIANNIGLQLSHDGLGQHLRGIDPLKDEHTLENVKALIDTGILSTVNCTLSQINPSWFDNIDYWTNTLGADLVDKLNIKLNHPYDSDYNFEFAFTDEEVTKRYLNEFTTLYWKCYNDPKAFKAFRYYILEQGNRYSICKPENNTSACRAYQSWKYNVPGNYKSDSTFVIMTTGEYGECNLAPKVDNPGGVQPDYCKDCKYKDCKECQHCGAMNYPKVCRYQKLWMETIENIWRTKKCLERSVSQKN